MPESLYYFRQTQTALRRMVITMAVFVLVTFLVLGFLIQQTQAYTAQLCRDRVKSVVQVNATWDRLIAIEQANTQASPALKAARVDAYTQGKLVVPACPK